MDQFVCVRLVQFNALDLAVFQFDYGLTWSAFFLNADRTLYGRYGSRGHPDGSVDVTVAGFAKAMEGALEIHKNYPANKAALAGKSKPAPAYKKPELHPRLRSYEAKISTKDACLHCHELHKAEYLDLRASRRPISDALLWRFPWPDAVGLKMDLAERATVKSVSAGSTAEKDGFRPGDALVSLEGQPLVSVADVQWVLEHAPETGKLKAEVKRGSSMQALTLTLAPGWRRNGDFFWRKARDMFRPTMNVTDTTPAERKALGLADNAIAIRVGDVWAFAVPSGIQKGDLIVEIEGRRTDMNHSQYLAYIAQKKQAGDKLSVKVLRAGREIAAAVQLP